MRRCTRMRLVDLRDRFLVAFLARNGDRDMILQNNFLWLLSCETGLRVEQVEYLVCNWLIQIKNWHRVPGFLWIDPRYEIRPDETEYEHHYGVLLKMGRSHETSPDEPLQFWVQEFAINRTEKRIRVYDSNRNAGLSQWTIEVSAREILKTPCPKLSPAHYSPHSDGVTFNPRGLAPVSLTRGWSVDFVGEIARVT